MTSKYQGRNRYRTFLRAGKTIAEKISRLKGVVGILGNGSLGRKFGDAYSDLDLTVYAHGDTVRNLRRLVSVGWISYKDVEFDIPVVWYEKALKAGVPSQYWTQLRRWDQQNSLILYDTNDRIKKLLEKKLVYPDREQERLLEKYSQEVHDNLVFFPELWAERGRLYNVIDALVRAVQSIVLWIYAKNKTFEPYISKWPFYHLETHGVPEHVYLGELTEVYTGTIRTVAGAMRIRKKLLHVCDCIGLRWEVYSSAEAHQRTIENWTKVSEETKQLLSW